MMDKGFHFTVRLSASNSPPDTFDSRNFISDGGEGWETKILVNLRMLVVYKLVSY